MGVCRSLRQVRVELMVVALDHEAQYLPEGFSLSSSEFFRPDAGRAAK